MHRDHIAGRLAEAGYVADSGIATALWLMDSLQRPLLLEGEAGVGKTEVAKALASIHGSELIRLQCYEGLDQAAALYEWNYQRQLLAIKAREGSGEDANRIEAQIFSETYLLERPLLAAIRREKAPVLLIDEIDRADEEFEAFLLELLSDFQVTIPEMGTIKATTIPRVILTSNGTRELSDALRRRCLYHYVDFPTIDREVRIILTRLPQIQNTLAHEIAHVVHALRKEELRKVPGVAETLDWAASLMGLDLKHLKESPEAIHATLICLLKTHEDRVRISPEVVNRLIDFEVAETTSDDLTAPIERMVAFIHVLRDNDFHVGLAESRDGTKILASPLAQKPHQLCAALKALCCSTHMDWQKFDRLFDAFFLAKGMKTAVRLVGAPEQNNRPKRHFGESGTAQKGSEPDTVSRSDDQSGDNPADGLGRKMQAARNAATQTKDLRKIVDAEEIAKAKDLAERLAHAMRAKLTRRMRARAKGQRLDLRRTIRASISQGGEPVNLVWRQRKPKPLRLVVLLDASGSMELYAPFFIRFMHGVVDSFREAEAFLFHTRLVHIAAALRDRNPTRAIERLGLMAQGMGGGTKIGESLADFNLWHARRVVHSRSCVMIMSDGYDTGDAGILGREMKRLRQRCKRIVWLNPMMGWDNYEPTARGMSEAMPYIDLFAPAHNLESLAALEPYLARASFALATVVRTVSVTAAKAGAKAVIGMDGTISEGWIGGGCARAAVLKIAREVIADGQPRLVSIQPEDELNGLGVHSGDEKDGIRFARNMCPSQGTMDIFIEPVLPKPQLIICGSSPVAVALAELGPKLGYQLVVCAPATEQVQFTQAERRIEGYALDIDFEGRRFIVVATQGRGDELALRAALSIQADYTAFVGSFKKVAALKEKLVADGIDAAQFDRLHAPAGLDLGAISPEDIALSIFAQMLQERRKQPAKA
eukprot:gene2431-2467_t